MRGAGYLLVLAFAVLACAYAEEVELYSDKYDYIDAAEVVANERLREQYYKCFMDMEPCVTPDAIFFKGNFAELLATKCKRCTEKQKKNFEIMADWYTKNQPDKWEKFVAKFLEEAKQKYAERK